MKLLREMIVFLKKMRPCLAVACFLAVAALLSGCGQEDMLLSELRREEAASVSGPEECPDSAREGVPFQEEKVWVHVCGAVKSPGVYELPAGSRSYEAVEAAGGFTEDACEDYLNMAAALSDGSRLEIPTLKDIMEREAHPDEQSGLVNINTADVEKLCSLPGVGEGRAKAIIEYRERQGGFRKKEDIMQVSGIGEKMYERMEAYLAVE